MKWIENRKNIVKNRWDFVGIITCACKCVCVCVCVCGGGYSCVVICVFMRLSQFANAVRWISGCEFEGVSLHYFISVCVGDYS